jgi:hypothetical protein
MWEGHSIQHTMGQETNKHDKTRGIRRMSKTNKVNGDMLKSTHE